MLSQFGEALPWIDAYGVALRLPDLGPRVGQTSSEDSLEGALCSCF